MSVFRDANELRAPRFLCPLVLILLIRVCNDNISQLHRLDQVHEGGPRQLLPSGKTALYWLTQKMNREP